MPKNSRLFVDFDSERALLGCIIKSPDLIDNINGLNKDWFHDDQHQNIYKVIISLHDNKIPIDDVVLNSKVNDSFSLLQIMESGFVVENYQAYAEIVGNNYLARRIKDEINYAGYAIDNSEEPDVNQIVDRLVGRVERISTELTSETNKDSIGNIGIKVMSEVRKAKEEGIDPFIVKSDLATFNDKVPGLLGGDMAILAGRPSSGKTAFALQYALNNARNGVPTGFISLEMQKESLFTRILSHETGLSFNRIKKGELTNMDFKALTAVWRELSDTPLYIDDSSGITDLQLKSIARKMKKQNDIELLIIDYMQLLSASKRTENRQQEVTSISKNVLDIARSLNIPVLALSQLSRALEQRENKKPRLSDLRESGSLEQDATHVFLLYNPSYYGIDSFEDGSSTDGVIEIEIAKYRNGATGHLRTAYIPQRMQFKDLYSGDIIIPEKEKLDIF